MNVVTVKYGSPKSKEEWMGARLVFLWETVFSVVNRRIARRVSSLIWVALGEKIAIVGGNCLQEGKGPVHRKRVLADTT